MRHCDWLTGLWAVEGRLNCVFGGRPPLAIVWCAPPPTANTKTASVSISPPFISSASSVLTTTTNCKLSIDSSLIF